MFLTTDSIVPHANHLMLWVGNLHEEELQAYLEEPGGRIDGRPQSKFAEDLMRFYDHDFLWAKASSESTSLHDLAVKMGIRDTKLLEKLERQVPNDHLSCLVILWNYRTVRPLTQQFAYGKLRFVGDWPYPAPFTGD